MDTSSGESGVKAPGSIPSLQLKRVKHGDDINKLFISVYDMMDQLCGPSFEH